MGFLSKLFRKAENKQQGKSAQEDDSASARQAQKKDSPTGSGELPHLLAQLQTNTYVRRLEAAAALAKLGDPAALPALEAMSHGTDDPWVLFDDEMRARAKIAYPSGVIPFADRDMLRSQLQGTNDRLKRAAQAAIAQIRESASLQTSEEAAMKVLDDAIPHSP